MTAADNEARPHTEPVAVVVDASVWVSRLVTQDVHHDASRRWLEDFTAGGGLIVAPALLLVEVAGAIARRTGQANLARQAIQRLLQMPALRIVAIDPRLGWAAAELATSLQLRGADATYAATAQRLDLPLVTWDEEQRLRAGRAVAVYRPGDHPSPSAPS